MKIIDRAQGYIPMARILNAEKSTDGMHLDHRDETYPVPTQWLRANASAFHFSDAEIISAACSGLNCVENCAGIYFLISGGEIIYVGLSNQIHMRLRQHRAKGWRWDAQTWFELPILHLRSVESYYIRRIIPPLNVKIPLVEDFAKYVKELGLDANLRASTSPKIVA